MNSVRNFLLKMLKRQASYKQRHLEGKKAIPFANKPEDIVPGVANYYATTYVQDGEAVSVVAKVRDGRPIKIEGNELSPITYGGTSARVQASVLDLYDGARLRFPTAAGAESTFEESDKAIATAITGNVVLLTSTVNSPSSLEVIKQFLAKYPGSKHIIYDAISYSGMLLANEATYGKKTIPSYRLEHGLSLSSSQDNMHKEEKYTKRILPLANTFNSRVLPVLQGLILTKDIYIALPKQDWWYYHYTML